MMSRLEDLFPLTRGAITAAQKRVASKQRALDLKQVVVWLVERADNMTGDIYGSRPFTDGARGELRVAALALKELVREGQDGGHEIRR